MRRVVVAAVVVLSGLVLLVGWNAATGGMRSAPVPPPTAWDGLDAQSRCDSAAQVVTHRDRWPILCRWREPGGALVGQSFPPPRGPAPFDDPHVEIYVAREQTREQLAHAIAHELGHMHHTREPAFVADWLAARDLPPETPWQVWTEDYAEVFAALFGPPASDWRAATTRPSAEALEELRARFFA